MKTETTTPRHVCSGCGKPGTPARPLLHAIVGYAHDGCDDK